MATNPYAPGRNPWTMPTTGPGATGAGANAYNQYQQGVQNVQNNPYALWQRAGGATARTGADVWNNPTTALPQNNLVNVPSFKFNYQNPFHLGDAEGAMMRSGQKFQTSWQEQEMPNLPGFQQWASSTDKFGGMWNPTDAADIAAGTGADANTAFRNWANALAQRDRPAYNALMGITEAPELSAVERMNAANAAMQPAPTQTPQQAQQGGQMQPWQLNPYLQQQADGIASSAITDFQRTIAPGIRSGAMAAGGYGGSRQGIAEGIAVGDLQRNIANAQSKLFGDAYEGDQNRATTRYASDNSLFGSMYGADRGLEGTKYSADAGERSSRYSADSSRAASRYSADAGLAGTRYSADSSRAASAYGADRSFDATRYSSDNTLRGTRENIAGNRYIAEMGDRTTQRGQDMNYSLGDRRLGLDTRTADQNYGLGLGAQGINQQNANTNRLNADNQYTLGLGNLGVNQGQLGVAQQNAATNRLSTDNAYNLGLGQLGVSQGNLEVNRTNAANSANAANNQYLLGLGQLGVSQANAGTNAAGTGAQMTTGSLNAASNLLNSLYQMGITDMNNPLMQMLLPYINSLVGTSTGNTTTTTRP